MKRTLLTTIAAVAMFGCAATATADQQIVANLTVIANAAGPDLVTAYATAAAMNPPSVPIEQCVTAAQAIAADIKKVMAAAGVAPGVFTQAAIALALQPGSPQFNQEVETAESGCIALAHQVNAGLASAAGMPAALASALAIASPVK